MTEPVTIRIFLENLPWAPTEPEDGTKRMYELRYSIDDRQAEMMRIPHFPKPIVRPHSATTPEFMDWKLRAEHAHSLAKTISLALAYQLIEAFNNPEFKWPDAFK